MTTVSLNTTQAWGTGALPDVMSCLMVAAHLIFDIHLAPVVEVQVVTFLLHHGRDVVATEDPEATDGELVSILHSESLVSSIADW